MIAIIDFGFGNLGSLKNMCNHLNIDCQVVNTAVELSKADKIILPGVGAFDAAIHKINKNPSLKNELISRVKKDLVPFLGICLGFQLLFDASEEGRLPGLGLVAGKVKKFNLSSKYKIPHMGWNNVCFSESNPLGFNLPDDPRFYFVHSFYVQPSSESVVSITCEYERKFVAGISKDNIHGVQFHPEKSHSFGKKLLQNFSEI